MTTRLLIDCHANVNALDIDGNTPLHILVQNMSSTNVFKTIDLLCDAGIHLDYVNNKRQTPLESVSPYRFKTIEWLKAKMTVFRLKCLCAQIIQRQQLSYQNLLSTSLVNFVQKH
jgi:ankyrin repeat protein